MEKGAGNVVITKIQEALSLTEFPSTNDPK